MAKKGSFSKVYDKNGDYVDVEAARFDGTRTFQMQGDVTASQTWNGDPSSPLTLNASIGAKKVTTDKINDKAVQAQQIDDGAVGLTQIATAAMNGTVQDNDSKLATHAAVKTYVDSQISGQGTYLGKHTVAEINAMVTDNLHNGDRVMTSDSGTINLGPGGVGFDVEAGEDLILYKSGSTVQWDSMDGNFKTKQTAVSDPTASGTGLTFIDSASQDENGEMTLSKKTVQDGTTSQKGVVQLEDSHSSTSTTKAATPNSVKEAYDLANTANTGAVKNVAYDSTNKKITKTINGTTTDVVSAATLKTDMALNNVDNTSDANKPVSTAQQAALDLKLDKTGDGKDVTATFTEASTRANIGTGEKLSVIFGKIKKWFTDLGTAAFKNVPASGNASSTEVVLGSDTRLSAGASAVQDVTVDGASVVNLSTKVADVPNASTSAKGAVQLAGSIGATVASENNKAATEKAVRDAVDTRLPMFNVASTLTSLDFNDFTSTGFHYCGGFDEGFTSYSHAPMSLARSISWRLEVINRRARVEQILVLVGDADSVAKNYKRHRSSGNVWSDWQTFVFESDLSSYEQVSNKVSAWQTTPDDTHYPSEKLVKDGLDTKADKVANATSGNFASLDANGNLTDSGKNASDFATSAQGGKADSAIQGVKVNNTTLTPDANKVVTVPLATTSADGAMSAADKTKLDGIAEGAEANVQADWDETSSSADSFIKNKPYHVKYQVQAGSYKVCSMPKLDNGNEKCLGLEFTYVKGYGGLKGTLLYKNNFKLYLQYCNNPGTGSKTITFKYVNNETTVDLYAITSGTSVTLKIASLANMPKSDIDFTDFGTSATVPEGATEITPVWVANSASSSGTAPVKVDAYGALTPVPMDSTPTASSTNLMTSGDIKTALDKKQDANPILFYGIKVVKKVTESKNDNIGFEVYTNFAANACTVKVAARLPAGTASVPYNTDSILRRYIDGNIETSLRLLDHVYYKVDGENIELYFLNNIGDYSRRGIIKTTTGVISGVSYEVLKSSVSTTGLTALSYTVNGAGTFIPHTNTAVGSATTPVFADANGEIKACTDDFVHDAEIAKMVQVETAGTAAGSSVNPVFVNASGVASKIDFSTWKSARGAGNTLNNMPIAWYVSNGTYSVPSGELTQYVEISNLDDYGYIDFWFNILTNNSPFTIHLRVNTYASGRKSIELLERSGYDNTHIESVSLRVTSNADRRQTKVYLKVLRTFGSILWRSSADISNSNFSVLTEQQYNALSTYEIDKLNITEVGTTARTRRHYQRNNAVLDTGDVKSTYSSTGTDPVNGTAVAAALATSLTDVAYAANASGGGGNLNKTKNGSTTSVLAFMTTAEARSVWTNAKAAVANAS